jgi:hypothetical protein
MCSCVHQVYCPPTTQYCLLIRTTQYTFRCKNLNIKMSWGISLIALAIITICLTATTFATLTSYKVIPYSGTITTINLGVYTDSGCTQNLTALSAVSVSPGSTTTQTVWIKNTGNVPENLTMTVSNWNPSNAGSYLALTWNQQNTVLSAGQSIQATITLTAQSNTGSLTTFACDITFTGTQ